MGLFLGLLPPLGIIAAWFGGAIGTIWVYQNGRSNAKRAIIEAFIASISAAAITEYKLSLNQPWLCCAVGVGVGLVVGYCLDAIKMIAPNFVRTFLQKTTERLIK